MQKASYVHPCLVKQCLHVICTCICVWVGTGRGSSPHPPFFFSLFSAGKSWMPSLFTEFSFGVVRILLHTTDSLMFLKLTKLLYASFSLLLPYTLTSSSWPDPSTTENQRGESGHRLEQFDISHFLHVSLWFLLSSPATANCLWIWAAILRQGSPFSSPSFLTTLESLVSWAESVCFIL